MLKSVPIRIFELIVGGFGVSANDSELLATIERKNKFYSYFISSKIDVEQIIEQRSQLLRSLYPEISQSLIEHNICIDPPDLVMPMLWHYWLPLAQSLAAQQQALGRTFIQGLLGGQGTGKTTLGIVLKILLRHLGKTFLSISLDDFYKTYAERQKLRERQPEMIWRGPPSTHDLDLGIQTLRHLRDRNIAQTQPIAIPRFDKSLHNGAGDRIEPEISDGADIVLFEGWFVGMRPLPISAFRTFVPPILTECDREFALECNANLDNYLPLWEYIDSLIVIVPEDYTYSLEWRIEAEHKLIASGKSGMNDQEITQFVEYCWKALHPELFMPRMIDRYAPSSCADLVIEISRSHLPIRIYGKK
ncbi:glycerate kinase [Pseudanabaena sp. FACHB-723]|uniref:Glycerate kinase n=1 Tax=Pseudanabaena mucicola FACHB-723 TaxID=2692860 RepID=A0ABR7ZZD8_9CYAN|nr:glycerate kinase [Pseudanabaena mucicola FACHB-723]